MKEPFNSIATSSKTHFEESEEEEEIESSSEEEKSDDTIDSDEEEEIERELAEVTFEELQKARADGTDSISRKPQTETKRRRANKNRPMELSSKKPVRSFRQVIQAPKKVVRDPVLNLYVVISTSRDSEKDIIFCLRTTYQLKERRCRNNLKKPETRKSLVN